MRNWLAAVLCVALAGPAWAQMDSREGIQLQNQILELRRDLQDLQMNRGGPPPPPYPPPRGAPYPGPGGGGELTAQLLDRVASLEEQVRRLHGQLDEQANAARRAQEDLAKQIADLGFRVQNAAAAPRRETPEAAPPPPAVSAPPATARRTPEMAMQEGNAALARRDYAAAEAAAREVLAGNRGTPRAGDADFLLAQALMGQRNFQQAALAYNDAYNRSRKGSRAPDALLGLALALSGLGEKPSACATLDKMRGEFPSVRADLRDAAVSLRARNGCR